MSCPREQVTATTTNRQPSKANATHSTRRNRTKKTRRKERKEGQSVYQIDLMICKKNLKPILISSSHIYKFFLFFFGMHSSSSSFFYHQGMYPSKFPTLCSPPLHASQSFHL